MTNTDADSAMRPGWLYQVNNRRWLCLDGIKFIISRARTVDGVLSPWSASIVTHGGPRRHMALLWSRDLDRAMTHEATLAALFQHLADGEKSRPWTVTGRFSERNAPWAFDREIRQVLDLSDVRPGIIQSPGFVLPRSQEPVYTIYEILGN